MLDGRRNTEEGVKIVIGGQIFPRARRARQLPRISRGLSRVSITRSQPDIMHFDRNPLDAISGV